MPACMPMPSPIILPLGLWDTVNTCAWLVNRYHEQDEHNAADLLTHATLVVKHWFEKYVCKGAGPKEAAL